MIDIKRNRYLDPIAEEWLSNVKKFFNTTRRPYIIQGAKRKYFNSYASKLRYECLSEIFNNTNDKKQRKHERKMQKRDIRYKKYQNRSNRRY